MSSAARRQLRLIDELGFRAELAFAPTRKADDPTLDGAHLSDEPNHQLYLCGDRFDPQCRATASESDLACCSGQAIEEIPGGTVIGPIDL